jgi:hypothetical protein
LTLDGWPRWRRRRVKGLKRHERDGLSILQWVEGEVGRVRKVSQSEGGSAGKRATTDGNNFKRRRVQSTSVVVISASECKERVVSLGMRILALFSLSIRAVTSERDQPYGNMS